MVGFWVFFCKTTLTRRPDSLAIVVELAFCEREVYGHCWGAPTAWPRDLIGTE